jgi:hypothetical protein
LVKTVYGMDMKKDLSQLDHDLNLTLTHYVKLVTLRLKDKLVTFRLKVKLVNLRLNVKLVNLKIDHIFVMKLLI